MNLMKMTDAEILRLSKPIILDTIYGANNKDWQQFSKHMQANVSSDIEKKKDVERQWDEDEYLTTFTDEPEFLGVIRKSDVVLVLWKMKCTINDEEYLEKLYLEEIQGKIYQVGIWTE